VITDRSAAVLAHGLGGSTDLPVPFTYALIGAAWALTFTFAVKVGCVVAGHIAGVIAAHDRALRLSPASGRCPQPAADQLTGQLAMMLVMVGYTFTGLYLLFGG